MLDTFQSALYQRLQAFELDDPNHEFGFTRQLMRNQGWSLTYTQRAIAEYKKFAFLTVVAKHQVVPSDQVDQVWHAHLLLTQSYWNEFCPKVLGKTLHHHPARGGRLERAEFHRLYAQTIASYQQVWGSPPVDLWSPTDVRFGAELNMQRVSLNDHWVIPKRYPYLKFAQLLSIMGIIALVTIGWISAAQGSTIEPAASYVSINPSVNPSVVALCSSAILGLMVRYIIRSPDQQSQRPQLDIYQMAYLEGGKARAVDLAIMQLVYQGYLYLNVRHRTFAIAKWLPPEAASLERQLMQQVCLTPYLQDLRRVSQYDMNALKRSLEQEKLLVGGWAAYMTESFGLFIFMTIFSGILIPVVEQSLGIQIPDMSSFTVLHQSIGIATLCCFVPGRRTRWGIRTLIDIKKNHDAYNLAQRFALYGYTVLSGGVLDDLKQIFSAEDAAMSSGGCGC